MRGVVDRARGFIGDASGLGDMASLKGSMLVPAGIDLRCAREGHGCPTAGEAGVGDKNEVSILGFEGFGGMDSADAGSDGRARELRRAFLDAAVKLTARRGGAGGGAGGLGSRGRGSTEVSADLRHESHLSTNALHRARTVMQRDCDADEA